VEELGLKRGVVFPGQSVEAVRIESKANLGFIGISDGLCPGRSMHSGFVWINFFASFEEFVGHLGVSAGVD
jgi:hypothetical protein